MKLFDILFKTLTMDGWNFEHDEKNELFRIEIEGVHASYLAIVIIDEEQESLLCSAHIKRKIPFTKRLQVCNFINRINYELALGNFEMDMDDGELRVRTYLDTTNTEPSKEQLINLIYNGAQTFDTYYPGLIKIILEDFSAEEAIEFCILPF